MSALAERKQYNNERPYLQVVHPNDAQSELPDGEIIPSIAIVPPPEELPVDLSAYRDQKQKRQRKIQRKEALVSNAFDVDLYHENEVNLDNKAIYNDIVSYLGEFRFQLQKFDYELVYAPCKYSHDWKVLDPVTKEAMSDKATETVRQRRARWQSSEREEAELQALTLLDRRLKEVAEEDTGDKPGQSQNDRTVVWGSPPGDASDGYGNYGYLFVGKIHKNLDKTLRLHMTAVRVEVSPEDKNRMINQFNSSLSTILEQEIAHKTPEDFLRSPYLYNREIPMQLVDHVLKSTFLSKTDEKQQQIFKKVIEKSQWLIADVVQILKTGTLEERIRAFTKLEGYVLQLKKQYEQANDTETTVYENTKTRKKPRLQDLNNVVFLVPPIMSGSCPIMGSANMFNGGMSGLWGFIMPGSTYGERDQKCNECPLCHKKDIVAKIRKGRIYCPACNGSAEYAC